MDLSQFREMYVADVTERLVRMNQLVLALESDPVNSEMINTLFRETHSLKGMAASMQYEETEKLAHHLESFLDACRKEGKIPKDVSDRLLIGFDFLEQLKNDIENSSPERMIDLTSFSFPPCPPDPTSRQTSSGILPADEGISPTIATSPGAIIPPGDNAPKGKNTAEKTVRIKTELLDQFMNLTGELITNRFMLQSAFKDERWGELDNNLETLRKLVDKLHHHVLQARMIPLERITAQLPRLVRDLCRKTGKEVTLLISGEQLQLDRSILEIMTDPLNHLVRNAVDHGIEQTGKIVIRAWREKNMAFLEIKDDGRGISPTIICSKAIEKGLISREDANALNEKEILQLICTPGFSTAVTVSEISGRGVGMDIVKTTVDSLGGSMEISSTPGCGTAFLLKIPLTIFIIRILVVRCAGHIIALPLTRILRVQEFSLEETDSSPTGDDPLYHSSVDHLVSLAALLNFEGAKDLSNAKWLASTELNGKIFGLVFDELIGQREAYVKPIAAPLDRYKTLSGATILGDGQVIFIIDPLILLQQEMHFRTRSIDHSVEM